MDVMDVMDVMGVCVRPRLVRVGREMTMDMNFFVAIIINTY